MKLPKPAIVWQLLFTRDEILEALQIIEEFHHELADIGCFCQQFGDLLNQDRKQALFVVSSNVDRFYAL